MGILERPRHWETEGISGLGKWEPMRFHPDAMNFSRLLISLIAFATVCAMPACKTKPSAAFYEGSGPSIHYYDEPETAGGAIRRSVYR
jgi:hypothetical protein